MNFQSFAELAFIFTLTPGIVAASLAFALAMGFVGGFLPAARAARLKIVDALRAASPGSSELAAQRLARLPRASR